MWVEQGFNEENDDEDILGPREPVLAAIRRKDTGGTGIVYTGEFTPTHKWCNHCKAMLPHEMFSRNVASHSGLQGAYMRVDALGVKYVTDEPVMSATAMATWTHFLTGSMFNRQSQGGLCMATRVATTTH